MTVRQREPSGVSRTSQNPASRRLASGSRRVQRRGSSSFLMAASVNFVPEDDCLTLVLS